MKYARRALSLTLAIVMILTMIPSTFAILATSDSSDITTLYFDASAYLDEELAAIPVSEIKAGLTTDKDGTTPAVLDGDIVAYARGEEYIDLPDGSEHYVYIEDDFQILEPGGVMDLSSRDGIINSFLILVGSADQLDPGNKYYRVYLNDDNSADFEAQITDEDGNPLDVARIGKGRTSDIRNGIRQTGKLTFIYVSKPEGSPSEWEYGDTAKLSLSLSEKIAARGYSVSAYSGFFRDEIPADAEDLTEQLFEDGLVSRFNSSSGVNDITFVFTKGDNTYYRPGRIYIEEATCNVNVYLRDAEGRHCYQRITYDRDNRIFTLDSGYTLTDTYRIWARASDDRYQNDAECIQKAVVGSFATLDAAAGETDIKAELFSNNNDNYFEWNFTTSGNLTLTFFDTFGEAHTYTLSAKEPEETQGGEEPIGPSSSTYFRIYSARDKEQNYLDVYTVTSANDSYYDDNGYQTIFLLDKGSPVTGDSLTPYFSSAETVTIYASIDGGETTEQKSGVTVIEVPYGRPIQYSASAEDGRNLRNYWVTFLTQETGAALFVNGATNSAHLDEESRLPVREVYLDAAHEYHHDILFANIGNTRMTGLKVELNNGAGGTPTTGYGVGLKTPGVMLDDYWTISDDSVGTLEAFTTTSATSTDAIKSMGKIRLVPEKMDSFAEVSGTLVISADDCDPVTIKLTGIAGEPRIITTKLNDNAVRFVPYSSLIQTNYAGKVTDAIAFSIVSGRLPNGVIIKPNGEIYGVPTEKGTFTFTVQATYKGDHTVNDTAVYTLVVADNTAENVEKATDTGYEILNRIPDETIARETLYRSQGEFLEFIDLWLDGVKLAKGIDYSAESGSTKITIFSETMANAGIGEHTIAAEFRVGGNPDNELKRTAQNFKLTSTGTTDPVPPVDPQPTTPPVTPYTPPTGNTSTTSTTTTTSGTFRDVLPSAWYYNDVNWVSQKNIMVGTSSNQFSPDGLINAGTIVTVLARTIGVDLKQYETDLAEHGDQSGEWHSAAMSWAVKSGLLDSDVDPEKPMTRGQMAVLLYKYFKYVGVNCALPEVSVAFADADQMTAEENDAFQILLAYGIFKGIGDNTMDVAGYTTRCQLAALMHRISGFLDKKI